MGQRKRHPGESLYLGSGLLQGAGWMRGELGNQLGAIRVNLARGRMKDAVLNPGETFFSIGPQGGGHGVGSGVTQFGNLAMG
jgi:hypothetical protein